MVPVKHDSVALWNRVAVGSSIERRKLKEILLFFFSYFGVRISLFPIFWLLSFLFSYFPSVSCH